MGAGSSHFAYTWIVALIPVAVVGFLIWGDVDKKGLGREQFALRTLPSMVFIVWLGSQLPDALFQGGVEAYYTVLFFAFVAVAMIVWWGAQRCNDLGVNKWRAFGILVPVVGWLYAFYLMLRKAPDYHLGRTPKDDGDETQLDGDVQADRGAVHREGRLRSNVSEGAPSNVRGEVSAREAVATSSIAGSRERTSEARDFVVRVERLLAAGEELHGQERAEFARGAAIVWKEATDIFETLEVFRQFPGEERDDIVMKVMACAAKCTDGWRSAGANAVALTVFLAARGQTIDVLRGIGERLDPFIAEGWVLKYSNVPSYYPVSVVDGRLMRREFVTATADLVTARTLP